MFRKIKGHPRSDHQPPTVLGKGSTESLRGIILASVVILIILGLIAISIFIVTPIKYLRKYNPIPLEKIVQLTQGTIPDKLIWSDDEKNCWFYTSEGLWMVFSSENLTTAENRTPRSIFLFSFSSRKDLHVNDVTLSPDKTTWLVEYDIEHGSINSGGKSYEVIILGQSNNLDVERFDLTFLVNDKQAVANVIRWANQGTEMVAAIEDNFYFSKRLSTSTLNFGFVCLTCNSTQKIIYGQPHFRYLAMYDYENTDVFWMSPVNPTKVIFMAFQRNGTSNGNVPKGIGKLSEVRNMGLIIIDTRQPHAAMDLVNVPIATENLTILWLDELFSKRNLQNMSLCVVKAAWFSRESLLLMITSGNKRSLWILLCRLSSEGDPNELCQLIWHFRSANGIVRKPQKYDLQISGQGSVYAVLPHYGGSYTQYRVANLQISPSRLQWISPRDYDVQTLEFISNEVIIFTSEYKVEGSRHLLRFDRQRETIYCLTCTSAPQLPPQSPPPLSLFPRSNSSDRSQLEAQKNSALHNLYQRVAWVTVSPDGNRFAMRWMTGYENFRPLHLQQLPVAELRNRLTGEVTRLGNENEVHTEDKRRLSLVPTCKWADDLQSPIMNALAVVKITVSSQNEVGTLLLWTRYELPLLGISLSTVGANYTGLSEQPLVRVKRSLDSQKNFDMDHEESADPPSAKQQQSRDTHGYPRYERRLRLFDQPPLGFPFLLLDARDAHPEDGHWFPFSVLRCVTLDPKGSPETLDAQGHSGSPKVATTNALVRFWYPPMLNEMYITKYPFLLIVQKFHPSFEPKPHNLLQDLAFQLASEHEVVVARVEDWMGAARESVIAGNPIEEMKLYKRLLRTIVRNYHYIDMDRTSLIGYAGEDSYLAALLMSSQETHNIPRCGVLIAPIFNFRTLGKTTAQWYRGFYEKSEFKYGSANLAQNVRNLWGKSVLIVHDFDDPLYPFSQSVELTNHLLREKVDYDLLLHPYGTTGVLSAAKRTSFLRHVSNFLVDCYNRTSVRWRYIPGVKKEDPFIL